MVLNQVWMIRFFSRGELYGSKFSFCSDLYADVIANIILLHIFINLKTVFISWNSILKLKSFIQIGTFILIHKKQPTLRVAVNFVDETKHCASINHIDTPLQRYNTRKYSLGESILLAKTTKCTFLYILGVWMTTDNNFPRVGVSYNLKF